MTPRTSHRATRTVFACIVGLQLLVAVISIDLMSSVRAFVTGESLYSKGQKDAQVHLMNYVENHLEEDYQRVRRALAVPVGYRIAREALQQAVPNDEVARLGLIQGGSHPDDIGGELRLFRWFSTAPRMAQAVATWAEGDAMIGQLGALVDEAHAHVLAGNLLAPEVTNLRENAQRLNRLLTPLELRFATQIADAARLSQRLLLGLNLSLAVLLGISGLAFVRHSARVQAAIEDEVRRRRESLQRLLDSAAEGLYGVDTLGRCTFINRSALRMLGYEKESDLLGRELHALIHHSHADGSPRPTEGSRIARSYREQRELHIDDEVFWRRDGTSFPVEYWSHPMLQDGRLHGAVATFFDISERLNMQEALRQGEVRIAGLVDAVNDGVLTIDADERIVQFNRAAERLFSVPAREAIGAPVERFILRKTDGSGLHELSFDDVETNVRELLGKRPDGHQFPLEASLSRLNADRGSLVTAVLRDITGLQTARAERQAREALEASNRAKTEFLSRMSHELRTPLNAVLGFSQLLRLDAAEPPSLQQLERIQYIENAGAHLLALVNDVLHLSRVESGQMTVTLESVDLLTAVEDALSMVLPLAATEGISTSIGGLRSDLMSDETRGEAHREGPVAVVADRVRLRQVLVNLLSNAVKYNRPGGEVRVSWQIYQDRCDLRITDSGYGMAPDQLERLFEPFNRLGAEKSNIEGTGIGLLLSRRLMELMHGELRIESTVRVGTEASLTLACSKEAEVSRSGVAPPSQHGSLDDALHVLYAEDNEVNVEIVREIVKLRPSIVLDVAENGALAFQKARRNRPQLMLVDMNLGDMTGIELAKALHADPVTAGIRLVALSADALPEQIEVALGLGFEDYITKPINFRKLLNVLDGRKD